MGFFLIQWGVLVLGAAVHIALDRHPERRTPRRMCGLVALGGRRGRRVDRGRRNRPHRATSDEIADGIGYTQSMFQWEVGWADIAIGAAGVACAWKANGAAG